MLDPFSLVKDEVSEISNKLRSTVAAEVPELTSAAGYFFRAGAEGKRTCPTVLLLMASAIRSDTAVSTIGSMNELRAKHMCIAEITEMIHVASLIHDDVLDAADTRRGMDSLNSAVGDKLAVLAGDFLLFRAFSAAGSLDNTEVVSLLATALNNLVTGELMQMTVTPAQRCSMDYYLQKTYYKTAALISNSCKAVAVLAGQTAEVATLAYQYGRHLGIVTAPVLFAMEEFPELREIVERGFDDPSDVATALEYLAKSQGIERTRLLATEHAKLAARAIDALPEVGDKVVLISRQALKDLAQKLIRRTK
ncbi:hypothetical protein ACQJBY_030752 [Aegilops geniculata]